ncbi:MAG: putative DNA binding domain-containing protein [Clostridiales bacterium]|nr:putative DNA binding domain-containing protein [Clostridiales bacterium]MCI7618067.1 putative DNA binding domain-containing protein [Bacillota bacterium]MDD7035649.1 ATP-binding protein [Bacillota bacterium]MDY2920703.1 ATP-binding protein [Lentihominibacter sp.]
MKESRSLEFKERVTSTFLKTVCAYANFGDGVICFGIDDDGNVVGLDDAVCACLDIENRINDSISPAPDYSLSLDDKNNVITLEVREGRFKPYYYKGKAYKRNDTATIEVDRIELNRLVLEGENLSYDELESDEKDLKFFFLEEKMKKEIGISEINDDILRTLGIIRSDGKYSNAGALLADENSFCGIDCARFGETIDIIFDREILEKKSILQQYDEAVSLYRKYYQFDEIKGAARVTVETIPEKAFRETIANALVHRAWDINAHIRVAMYQDRIEVFSPGGLPKGITAEEYLSGQISVLRNPLIGGVFYRLNIIESFGTGIQRIDAAYAGSKVRPRHEFSPNVIKVVLPVISEGDELSGDEQIIYKSLSRTGKSSSQIIEASGFGKSKALRVLRDLEEKGYIRKTGNGRGTKYQKSNDK